MKWVRVSASTTKLMFKIKVKENEEYVFRVMAENAKGISEPALSESTIARDKYSKHTCSLVKCIYIA